MFDLKGSPNIVELLDVFYVKGSKKIILSFRFEKGGDLNYLLHKHSKYFAQYKEQNPKDAKRLQGLPLKMVIRLSKHLLNGILAIHSKGWIHRDLKPGNLMISEKFNDNWFQASFAGSRIENK